MSDLEDPLYKDWVRSALSLKYLKEGICDFVDRFAKQHHTDLLYSYIKSTGRHAVSCSECTSENLLPDHPRHQCIQKFRSKCFCNNPYGRRRKCPNKFCSRFYDLIVMCHDDANPLWINTNPGKWYSDHWEMAKCFLATTGYTDKNTASDTDAAGLLSIIMNNIEIRNYLNCIDNVAKARDIRNDIMHSKSFKVDRGTLHRYIDQMILVLQDSKVLINDTAAQNSVAKLEKLKRDQIYISLEDASEMRREALKAIGETKDVAILQIETKAKESSDRLDAQHKQSLVEQKRGNDDVLKNIQRGKMEIENMHHTVMKQIEEKEKHAAVNIDAYFETRLQEHESKIKNQLEGNIDVVTENVKHMLTEDEKGLQNYLLDVYQNDYVYIQISPLSTKDTKVVEELYVPVQAKLNMCNNWNEDVATLTDLFQHGSACFHTIYLTGEAGIGKSTFCRKLISLWCTVRQNSGETPNDYSPVFDVKTKTEDEQQHNLDVSDYDIDMYDDCWFEESETSDQEDSSSGSLSNEDLMIGITEEDTLNDSENQKISTPMFKAGDQYDRDSAAISKFDFLFFVSLRDTNQEVSIEDMITEQLLRKQTKLVDCFNGIINRIPERCLIILDGLDEWNPPSPLPTHPTVTKGLPISFAPRKCVQLLTSRRWKYESVDPRIKDDESEVRLTGIGEKASRKLTGKVLKASNGNNEIDQVLEFETSITGTDVYDLVSIPLLLKLLICLWQTNSKLEKSKTELYCSVINIMLHLAEKKDDLNFPSVISKWKLPHILENYGYIKKYINIIVALSQFAFHALFKEPYGSAVVFTTLDLEKEGLSSEQTLMFFRIGFLTQKSVSSRFTLIPSKSLSFIHKSFQEFFAALYVSMDDHYKDGIKTIISRRLGENESVLEMANVLHFLADLRQDLFLDILEQLALHNRVNTKITIHDSVLKLSLKKEDVCLTDIVLRGNPNTVVIESTNYGLDVVRFTNQNSQLQILRLESVALTHRAFKIMLESIPASENGVEVILVNIGWIDEQRENSSLLVEIENVRTFKIKFTNLTRFNFKLSQKIHSVELTETDLTDIGLVNMLNSTALAAKNGFEITIKNVNLRKNTSVPQFPACQLLNILIIPSRKRNLVTLGSINICTGKVSHREGIKDSQSCVWCELSIKDTDLTYTTVVAKQFDNIELVNVKATRETMEGIIGTRHAERLNSFLDIRDFSKEVNYSSHNSKEISVKYRFRFHDNHIKLTFVFTNTGLQILRSEETIDNCRERNYFIITCLKCIKGEICNHDVTDEQLQYMVHCVPELQNMQLDVYLENIPSEVSGLLALMNSFKDISVLMIRSKHVNIQRIRGLIRKNLELMERKYADIHIILEYFRNIDKQLDFIVYFLYLSLEINVNKKFLSMLCSRNIRLEIWGDNVYAQIYLPHLIKFRRQKVFKRESN